MRMVRKQVYLELRHDRMLKRRAGQTGVTEAQVIREILDAAEEAGLARSTRISNAEAGRKLLAFIRRLGGKSGGSGRRRAWNRESLYEDRIGRWTKS